MRAVFPGSFDPPTNGHIDIVHRAARIFDEVYIVIAVNPTKNYTFSSLERKEIMEELVFAIPNVEVHIWDKLVVDFAKKTDARVIVRGVRALGDFAHEFELSMLNQGLNSNIDTVFIPTDSRYFVLRSSAIKELIRLGGDVSTMVPQIVIDRMKSVLSENHS